MSEPRARPLLLLWGFMGTGKSTVGRALAAITGASFADLDAGIEARAGRTIAAIFAGDGEARFRELERAAIDAELAAPARHRVVALGGGALLDPEVRRRALDAAYVVVLTASPQVIAARTAASERPLLKHNPEVAIARLLAERAAAYDEAHVQVAGDADDAESVAAAVARTWILPPARDPDTLG